MGKNFHILFKIVVLKIGGLRNFERKSTIHNLLDINERRAQTVQVNTLLKQPNPFTHTRRKNTKNIAALSEAIKAAQFRAGRLDA